MVKDLFDFVLSIVALIIFGWIILLAWLVAFIETGENGFFLQKRVGKDGKLFSIIKIRTMKKIDGIETTITSADDIRITKSGKFFRNTKIDELPQFFNILKGDMSFVGPRPDVQGYADKLEGEDRIILSVKPGITGPASIKYKNEEEILSKEENPQIYNDTVIWRDKVEINKRYVKNQTLIGDIKYMIQTIIG